MKNPCRTYIIAIKKMGSSLNFLHSLITSALSAPEVKGHGNSNSDCEQNSATNNDQHNPNGGQTGVVTPQAAVMFVTRTFSR